jgi:REP element-mobilizing transposase RayT
MTWSHYTVSVLGQQLGLAVGPVFKWGGRREGAGRKRTKPAGSVTHAVRPFHERREPVLVTLKVLPGLPSLRWLPAARAVGETIRATTGRNARRGTGFRIVHFSIQSDHVHMLVEAGSKTTLARGLAGLAIALARRVNGVMDRRGKLFAERYHARALFNPRAVRNAIVYVLLNHLHHRPDRRWVDPCSSGRWFTGWKTPVPVPSTPSPVADPLTWLLRTGWLRYGPIGFTEGPA